MSLGDGGESGLEFETLAASSWPTITQFSVFLENRVGQLLELVRCFSGSKVRIVGLSIADSADCCIVRIMLSHREQGREILRRVELPFAENELLVAELSAGPRTLTDICLALLQGEVNIHYALPADRPPSRPSRRGDARRQPRTRRPDSADDGARNPLRSGPMELTSERLSATSRRLSATSRRRTASATVRPTTLGNGRRLSSPSPPPRPLHGRVGWPGASGPPLDRRWRPARRPSRPSGPGSPGACPIC